MRKIRPSKLLAELEANARSDIPSMIWGPPGVGKSQLTYQLSNKLQAKLFELRANLFDPVDVRGGLKVIEQADGTYRTKYGIPEDYPDPDFQGPVVLLIDELPNAPKATQNALLQLILDKKIGTYTLPAQTIIVAAGNRAADRAAVNEMPTPVKNRFAHYEIEPDIDDWCAWAIQNNIDSAFISFLRYMPKHLFNMDSRENAFPTPRSWEMMNRKYKHMLRDPESLVVGASAVVGDGVAGELVTFMTTLLQMPDIDQIIKSPGQVNVPIDMSILYAVAGALASRAEQANFHKICVFARRMPMEYQIVLMKDALAKDRGLVQNTDFKNWAQDNATVIL